MATSCRVLLPVPWALEACRAVEAFASGNAHREGHAPFAVTPREAQEIVALTNGMIGMIDDSAGRVMETLRKLALESNTVVVFTSDHGDHMGDHGVMLKSVMHFQGLIRVPFIWRDPQGGEGQTTELASMIDIAPTVLRRTGIQPNNGVQGRDLLDPAAAPESRLIESDNPFKAATAIERTRTLVTEDWRFTIHQGVEWGELYDLNADPHETTNLWQEPACRDTRFRLTETLLRRMIDMQENSPLQTGIS